MNRTPGDQTEPAPEAAVEQSFDAYIMNLVNEWTAETGVRKQERSKRREQEIMRASLRIFSRDGISRARIGDVALEAGMPVSSIYDYFPSKEALAYAVPVENFTRFYAEYAKAVIGKTTYRERLRLYLWLTGDFARRNPEWARLLYLEIWPSVLVTETDIRPIIDEFSKIIIHIIRGGEANGEWPTGLSPYETAAILIGSINQVLIVWLLYRKPRNLMKTISSVIDRVMALLPAIEEGNVAVLDKIRSASRAG